MLASQLLNILNAIINEYGDIGIELYIDKRQFENPFSAMQQSEIITEDLKLVKIKEDGSGIYLSNEFRITDEYKGCKCDVMFDPEAKVYKGVIIPPEVIEGFNTTFVSPDKYSIRKTFECAVEEYLDFLGNAKISKTYETVDKIKDSIDMDYGEIFDDDEEDEDYGEI